MDELIADRTSRPSATKQGDIAVQSLRAHFASAWLYSKKHRLPIAAGFAQTHEVGVYRSGARYYKPPTFASCLVLSGLLLSRPVTTEYTRAAVAVGNRYLHLCHSRNHVDINRYLEQKREEIDRFLDQVIPDAKTIPITLHQAMRYSLFAGGKRIRPILAIAAAEAVGTPSKAIFPIASSLELIHTYSLIHDDLPAMDDDDYRRGKPTNHKVYGEAMAILAGDALLTLAFELCSRSEVLDHLDPHRQVQVIYELAVGSGHRGMVGGQVLDIQAENKDIDLATLQTIHMHKTGMLIRASVRMGAIVSSAPPAQLERLTGYAEDIGLAFQIADDVLNVTGTREELGKNAMTDAQRGKKTYPTFYGVEGARTLADQCVTRAIGRLDLFDDKADPLRELARYIAARRN
jgi:geranylgeranyl diphosphate synthase, type II